MKRKEQRESAKKSSIEEIIKRKSKIQEAEAEHQHWERTKTQYGKELGKTRPGNISGLFQARRSQIKRAAPSSAVHPNTPKKEATRAR